MMLSKRYKDISDLISQAQDALLAGRLDRIEAIYWLVPDPTTEECDMYFSEALETLLRDTR